jgi:hypothetical protein
VDMSYERLQKKKKKKEFSDRARHPISLLFVRYRSSFTGIKRSVCEADHSTPSNTEVKNVWSNTSSHLKSPHAVDGNLYLYHDSTVIIMRINTR